MNVYATSDDLAAWTAADVPANATQLLRSASILIARAANRDLYTDMPTVTDALVLKDATTAQAAAWTAAGIDPSKLGFDAAPVKGKKIGTADVTYDTAGQSEARTAAATGISAEAKAILISGGLYALDLPVWTDPSDPLPTYGLPVVYGRSVYGGADIDAGSFDAEELPPVVIEQVIGY